MTLREWWATVAAKVVAGLVLAGLLFLLAKTRQPLLAHMTESLSLQVPIGVLYVLLLLFLAMVALVLWEKRRLREAKQSVGELETEHSALEGKLREAEQKAGQGPQ